MIDPFVIMMILKQRIQFTRVINVIMKIKQLNVELAEVVNMYRKLGFGGNKQC